MTMRADDKRLTQRRHDGWPLCPRCGKDELWCADSGAITLQSEVDSCDSCGWVPEDRTSFEAGGAKTMTEEVKPTNIYERIDSVEHADGSHSFAILVRDVRAALEQREATIRLLTTKHSALAEEHAKTLDELAEAKRQLAVVSTPIENVWRWQGDGGDQPESLSCPIVMSSETLRRLMGELKGARESAAAHCELTGIAVNWLRFGLETTTTANGAAFAWKARAEKAEALLREAKWYVDVRARYGMDDGYSSRAPALSEQIDAILSDDEPKEAGP